MEQQMKYPEQFIQMFKLSRDGIWFMHNENFSERIKDLNKLQWIVSMLFVYITDMHTLVRSQIGIDGINEVWDYYCRNYPELAIKYDPELIWSMDQWG